MPTDTTDAALIVRVLGGEAEAYTTLVDRHYEACSRYAARMLRNVDDAQDVVQETFLRAYAALGRYREQDRFRAWLFRILVNQIRSHARRAARRERPLVHEPESAAEVPAPPERDGLLSDALQRALDTLEPLLREALLLKYGVGMEYEDMARLTGASVSALKMRVKRGRDAIRPLLEDPAHE